MKNHEIKQIKKAIKELRKIRRNPPKKLNPEEIWAISYALDYLMEDLLNLENKK